MDTCSSVLAAIRSKKPLVLQITNMVTINDCANITIALGASPVMSNDPDDAAELAKNADALLLNIGTADAKQLEIMRSAADSAEEKGIPVVLDPVGANASLFRKKTVCEFMTKYQISIIKGNASEISSIGRGSSAARGIESEDSVNPAVSAELALKSGAVVAVSGAADLVTDGKIAVEVANGVPLMGRVCGTGCMIGSAAASAAAAASPFDASVFAFSSLGIAGERAASYAKGPGSFKAAVFDEAAALTPDDLERYARIREVLL